jgi:prepilin-type N-terminal cleavage/methylation domain-containing protein
MKRRRQNGFTLIELAIVMGASAMIALGLVGMLQAHVQVANQAFKYKFLAQDAPFVGLLLTKTIGNAEDYRIYSSGDSARSSSGTPLLTGTAIRLWMRQPNSTFRQAVVSYETVSGNSGLYFFLADSTGTFSSTPNWEFVGAQLANQTSDGKTITGFDASTGVLLVTLVGINNEWYKFAAEKK